MRKLDEAQIAAQQENNVMQVGSYATVPVKPSSPRKMVNMIVGGVLGLMAGCALVISVELFRGGQAAAGRRELAREG
jgi:uncharacterized protein involved in exopolysaccharide biosynthesis